MFGFGFRTSGLSGLSGLGKKFVLYRINFIFIRKLDKNDNYSKLWCKQTSSFTHSFPKLFRLLVTIFPAVLNTLSLGTEVAVMHWNFWAPKNKFGNWFFPTLNHHLIGSSDLPIVGRERYFFISKSMQSLIPFSCFSFGFELALPHSSSSSGCKNEKKY